MTKTKRETYNRDLMVQCFKKALKCVQMGWCQGTYSKSFRYNKVRWWSPVAQYYSAHGALLKSAERKDFGDGFWCVWSRSTDEISKYLKIFIVSNNIPCRETNYLEAISKWNDHVNRTQDQVVSAFEKAIEYTNKFMIV